jgi:hypothetical protein
MMTATWQEFSELVRGIPQDLLASVEDNITGLLHRYGMDEANGAEVMRDLDGKCWTVRAYRLRGSASTPLLITDLPPLSLPESLSALFEALDVVINIREIFRRH